MAQSKRDSQLRDETTARWSRLDNEKDACIVVSDRMELVYINTAARELVPTEWFGKRCFEVLPTTDQACALHCPTIRAVNESTGVVYCEETVFVGHHDRKVFGIGLIPLGPIRDDYARAIFLLRAKEDSADESAFRTRLLTDARGLAQRILARGDP